jgi:hypothetical protein
MTRLVGRADYVYALIFQPTNHDFRRVGIDVPLFGMKVCQRLRNRLACEYFIDKAVMAGSLKVDTFEIHSGQCSKPIGRCLVARANYCNNVGRTPIASVHAPAIVLRARGPRRRIPFDGVDAIRVENPDVITEITGNPRPLEKD